MFAQTNKRYIVNPNLNPNSIDCVINIVNFSEVIEHTGFGWDPIETPPTRQSVSGESVFFFLFLFTRNLFIHILLNISLEIYYVAADYKIYSNSINESVQYIQTLH